MIKSSGLVQRRLHCCSAHAGERSDLVNWQVAYPMPLDLERDNAKDRSLSFGVVMPKVVRHDRGSA
jgi:hypothetical protein